MSANANHRASAMTRLLLVLAAAAIGAAVAAIFWTSHASYTDEPMLLFDEPGLFLIHAGALALPFFLLGALGIRQVVPWLVGLGLTALVWGYTMYDAFANWETDRGANIGLGLLLLISPLIISGACLVAAWKWQTRRSPEA